MNEQMTRAYKYLQQQGFLPVSKESFPLFRNYEGENVFAEMTATVATVWSLSYNELYKVIDGYLCNVWFFEGAPVYFEIYRPIETPEYPLQHIVDTLYTLSREAGLPFLQIYAIEERFLEEYKSLAGYSVTAEYSDDHSEYIFLPRDFLELSGSINLEKRRHLRKSSDEAHISLRPITNENVRTCLEIEEEWCQYQDCSVCSSFAGCEKKAVEILTEIFDEHIYKGLFLYYDEKPVGYAIGQIRNEKYSFLFFGKSNLQNYFVYLIYTMVEKYFSDVEYFNMTEDMGKKGLRLFKSHLGKYDLWRKYVCTFTCEKDPSS